MDVRFVEVKSGRRHTRQLPCLVGRGDDAGFCIKNDTVSRHHCSFTFEGGVVHVTDLASTNGTALGTVKLAAQARTPVPCGAQVRIGGVVLRVEYSVAERGAAEQRDGDTMPLVAAVADSTPLVEPTPKAAPITEPAPMVDEGTPEPAAPVEEPAAEPPADVPGFADIDAAAEPAPDVSSFPDVEAPPAPADGSFDFLGGQAEAPPAADDRLDDFFKSLS